VARGRPPAFTREQVVDEAIAVADAEGLGAVTFRRVATGIGAGAMSLYTYVRDKDRLIDLMVDRVAEGVAWPAGLLELAVTQRRLMHRHPWLPGALPNRRLTGTNMLAYLDRGLAALAPTGLSAPAKLEVVALLTGFVASYVTNELAQAAAGGVSTAEQVELITAAVDTGDFPHLAAALAESATTPAPVSGFEAIAARMISGLTG
jgi:AcrR family transcriptional regulator